MNCSASPRSSATYVAFEMFRTFGIFELQFGDALIIQID